MTHTHHRKYAPDTAIQLVWSPMRGVPTEQGDKSVAATSAVLFTDSSNTDGHGARRVRIYNTDASATCGIFFLASGSTATGLSIANAVKIAPATTYEFVISNSIRVAAISSSGTITVNVLVHDLI